MNCDELFAIAGLHSREVWGEQTGELGAGHEILEAHGVERADATELALSVCSQAHATDTLPGLAALFLQGLIFGLWLADQEQA